METESLTLPVIGMTCASCQHHVESALKETAGVKSAHVDLMANRALVEFDPAEASAERLVEAIRKSGYDAVLPHPGAAALHGPKPSQGKTEIKAAATLVAGAIAMLVAMPAGHADGGVGPPVDETAAVALPGAAGCSALVAARCYSGPDGVGRPRYLRRSGSWPGGMAAPI